MRNAGALGGRAVVAVTDTGIRYPAASARTPGLACPGIPGPPGRVRPAGTQQDAEERWSSARWERT